MTCQIAPVAPRHIESFWKTCDTVFRESRMYAFTEAVPLPEFTRFVMGVIRNRDPQYVAVDDGSVIGWSDIMIKPRPALRHSGVFGLGVLREFRRQGIGRLLLNAALGAARRKGLTRVELFVRIDNDPAIQLYKSAGFEIEGVTRRHLRIDNGYHDSYMMSLLLD